jgi:methyl-accepting chemotaxis protein
MPTKRSPIISNQQTSKQKKAQREQRQLIEKAFQYSEAYRIRRYKLVRSVSQLALINLTLNVAGFGLAGVLLDSMWFWLLIPTGVWLILVAVAFLCATPSSSRRITFAAYLLVGGIFTGALVFQVILGAFNFSSTVYLFIIVLGALVGLRTYEIIWLAILGITASGSLVIAEKVLNIFKPVLDVSNLPWFQLLILFDIVVALVIAVLALTQSLLRALSESEYQAQRYRQSTEQLIQTTHFGQQISFSLNSIVTELNAASHQQANGAQEQVAAVMEITDSLTELGETARQIATNSNQVSVAVHEGLYTAARVKETTLKATNTARRGQAAVASSIHAIEEVRNGITGLAERLMILTESSRQISSIIALIKEIADETHLLALNAAIESAGSGKNGRRFAVVASEVKSLADRSLEATSEVAEVISDLQGAIAAAVLASEETRKKTFGAVERSYQAGEVITELGQVVEETALSSAQIVEAVQQVATLAEEIKLATQQQESAIRLIINTMDGVGTVAQENASVVAQVSETVSQIDLLSTRLKEALTRAPVLTPVTA